ncbi:hypothetical protein D9M70_526940 [compost metagenome]
MPRASPLKVSMAPNSLRVAASTCSPLGVRRKPALPRSHRRKPRRVSSLAICVLMVDWPTPSSPWAALNPPLSTTVTKRRSNCRSRSWSWLSMAAPNIDGCRCQSRTLHIYSKQSTAQHGPTCNPPGAHHAFPPVACRPVRLRRAGRRQGTEPLQLVRLYPGKGAARLQGGKRHRGEVRHLRQRRGPGRQAAHRRQRL